MVRKYSLADFNILIRKQFEATPVVKHKHARFYVHDRNVSNSQEEITTKKIAVFEACQIGNNALPYEKTLIATLASLQDHLGESSNQLDEAIIPIQIVLNTENGTQEKHWVTLHIIFNNTGNITANLYDSDNIVTWLGPKLIADSVGKTFALTALKESSHKMYAEFNEHYYTHQRKTEHNGPWIWLYVQDLMQNGQLTLKKNALTKTKLIQQHYTINAATEKTEHHYKLKIIDNDSTDSTAADIILALTMITAAAIAAGIIISLTIYFSAAFSIPALITAGAYIGLNLTFLIPISAIETAVIAGLIGATASAVLAVALTTLATVLWALDKLIQCCFPNQTTIEKIEKQDSTLSKAPLIKEVGNPQKKTESLTTDIVKEKKKEPEKTTTCWSLSFFGHKISCVNLGFCEQEITVEETNKENSIKIK